MAQVVPLSFGWQSVTSKNIGSQWAGYVYTWHVKAKNGATESNWSNTRTFVVRPSAPTNLSASVVDCSQLNLSWYDNSGNEEGYRVYQNGNLVATLGSGATSYQNTGLKGNTNYSYFVRAYRGNVKSNSSNTVSAKTSTCPLPPSAEFDAWPLSGTAPFTTAMHIVDMSNITSCSWNYGDGQTSTTCTQLHNHTYSNAGSYTVSLTVNGPGGSDSMTRTNYIAVTAPSQMLSVAKNGTGNGTVTSSPSGINCGQDCSEIIHVRYSGYIDGFSYRWLYFCWLGWCLLWNQ